MTPLSKARAERSQVLQLLPVFAAILAMMPAAWAATTDISNQPLATLPSISASPNLMFILDNSGSMSFEHMPDDMDNSSAYGYVSSQCNGTAYDPTVTYKPPLKYDGTSYPDVSFTSAPLDGYVSGGSTLNLGSSTATYASMNANNFPSGSTINNPFYHYYTYNKSKGSQSSMGWVYTASGVDTSSTFYKECYSNIGSTPGSDVFTEVVVTSTSAEKQNYANWFSYYRKRYLLMRTGVGRAINGLGSNYNVGFNAINGSDGRGNASAADGTYFRDVKPFDASGGSTSQKANFYTSLYGIAPSGATPLRGALAKAGQYFANKAQDQTYDPMQYACQRNYAMLTTDGYWNTDSGGVGPFQLDRATLVGNQDGVEAKPMYDGATSTTVTTVTTYTAPVTSTSRTATITWSRTKSSTTPSGSRYLETDTTQNFTQTQVQSTTAAGAETGTATKTVTDMVTDGVEVSGYPQTSAVSYSNWTNTGAPVWTTSSDSGAPTDSATATTGCGSTGWTDGASSSGKVKTPISPAQYSPSCKGSAASPTYTYTSPVVGTFVAGTPVVTMSSAGGSADTLADIAEYYYKTDLRNSSLGNCTSTSSGTSRDVCRDNVPPDDSSGDPEKFQHMNTFTIGLGVNGTLSYDSKITSTSSGTLVNWPNPCGSTGSSCSGGDATNVDDLWHAALDGRGRYYSALSAAALSDAINGALTTVTATNGSGSAASTSSLELVSGDNNQVYKASYTTGNWTGDVQAYTLNGDGSTIVTPALWSAQSVLDGVAPASRKIYFNNSGTLTAFTYANLSAAGLNTYFDNFCSKSVTPSQCTALNAESSTSDKDLANSGGNLVNYLIGVRGYEAKVTTATSSLSATNMPLYRARKHLLGDIINGAPVYIGKPPFIYVDAGYADFKTAQASRTPVVYAAANDGMLHAFSASTGQERWAFVPTAVIPNLYKLANASYATNHAYFVDGAPVMGDVYISGHWRTILVGGLNDGGQSYYALDVTDPSSAPTLLWEFTDPNLGLSYGNPVITKRKDGTWVVAFSSGYNNTSGDGNGHLFVVDAASGTKLLDIPTYTTGTTKAGSTGTPSGLGKVNAWVDDPTNNTSLRFYGGDLLGNLWRFDVDNLVLPNQGSQLLASFEAGGVAQPITTRPQTVVVGSTNRPVVVVATGRYLGVDDPANTDQQSIYAVADNLTATGWGDPRSAANSAVFVKQTISASGTTASVTDLPVDFTKATIGGWYVDLPHSGERVFTNPTLQFNTLVVASGIPNSDACTTGGASWLYYFNVKNGGVITSDVPVGLQLASDALAVGINWVKDSSGNVHILVQDSKGNIISKIPPGGGGGGPLGTFRTSWRELTN